MSENQNEKQQIHHVVEKFAGQRMLFRISHAGMLMLAVAYAALSVYVYKYYGSGADALSVKGMILSGGVIILILLGVLERAARNKFLRCPACGEQLNEGTAGSQGSKKGFDRDCPKCGARLMP
jgi:hypothetical protein